MQMLLVNFVGPAKSEKFLRRSVNFFILVDSIECSDKVFVINFSFLYYMIKELVEDKNVLVEDSKKNKKRRRDKHRARYSPEFVSAQGSGRHHSRKRKRKSSDLPGEQEPPRQGIKLFVSIFNFPYQYGCVDLLVVWRVFSPFVFNIAFASVLQSLFRQPCVLDYVNVIMKKYS